MKLPFSETVSRQSPRHFWQRSFLPLTLALIVFGHLGITYFVRLGNVLAYTANFDGGVAGFSATAEPAVQIPAANARFKVVDVGGDKVLQVRGQASLFALDAVAVNPSYGYRLKARVRVLTDDPAVAGATIYVGIATYDADGKLETVVPGTHRYAAANGKILTSSQGWVDVEGTISGLGNRTYNQFRPGTVTVRPMAIVNFRSETATTQITSLSLTRQK